jgi:fumarylacetoacetase
MYDIDHTHDPRKRSWVASANEPGADFPIQNLPLGVFRPGPDAAPRAGIAIGDMILDLDAALAAQLLEGDAALAVAAAQGGRLNTLLALGPGPRTALRRQASELLDSDSARGHLASRRTSSLLYRADDCEVLLPVEVRNYTDFYAGIHHARAAGALMMPDNPLPPNYKWVPIAYHGRASSVRVSGGAIRRPQGQRRPAHANEAPTFGPCERLDLELELGMFVGGGNALGEPVPVERAHEQIAGYCLLNDWSARDFQFWEMVPLGPFLGKNFSTTISPWIVTPEALAPFRCAAMARPAGDPQPLAYLSDATDQRTGGVDIRLAVWLRTARMRAQGDEAQQIIRSNARHLYWTPAQMIAHHTSGGCNLMPGDLIGSGTISGPERAELSSLLELTRGGAEPVYLANGERRSWLEDGDEVTFTARCEREGYVGIGFGRCAGRIFSEGCTAA